MTRSRFAALAALLLCTSIVACEDRDPQRSLAPGSPHFVKVGSAVLLPEPKQNDTTDHLDLVVNGDGTNLEGLVTLYAYDTRGRLLTHTGGISYTTVDPTIATVNNGVVTGVREGETLVTATVQGVSASLLVCVTDDSLPAPHVVIPEPIPYDTAVAATMAWQWVVKQGSRILAFRQDGSQLSQPCIHWTTTDPAIAVSRAGVVQLATDVHPDSAVHARATIGSTGGLP